MITLAGGGVEEEDLKKKKKKEQGVCRLGKEHLFFFGQVRNKINKIPIIVSSTSNQGPWLARHFVAIVLSRPSCCPKDWYRCRCPHKVLGELKSQTPIRQMRALKQWPCGPGRGAAAPGQR